MDSDPDSARNLLTHTDSKTFTPSSTNNNINGSPNTTRHNNHNQSLQQKPETMGTKNKTYAGGSSAQGVAMGYHDTARLQKRVARLTSYLYGLAVIVVVGGVILIAIIASLYAKLYYDLTHHSHQPKVGEQIAKILEREELCVPCSEVRLGPSPDEENMLNVFTKRDSKDGQKCCVERPAELLRLLELTHRRIKRNKKIQVTPKAAQKSHIKFPDYPGGTSGPQDKPAAHLMGYPQRQDLNQAPGRQFPIGIWIHEEDLAFTNHVTYRHGRIVVPDDGLYYVYSQIAFLEVLPINGGSSVGSGSSYGTESPSLSHYLYRYNIIYPNGGEEKLVQNSITKCWGPNKAFGEYTSYLGAVIKLRKGDEVFVKVSNLTMMARDPKSSYFGLFKI